jgi:hypothetical protein
MTHDSFEKKLTYMNEVACAAPIGKKRLILKAELR